MVEAILVNLEDGGGESGLRQLFHGKADGGGGAWEPAIGHRLAHSRPSLGRKQFGWGTIVERAGQASCTPWRRPAHAARAEYFRRTQGPLQVRTFPSFARKRRKTKPQMNGRLSSGSAAAAYEDGMSRAQWRAAKPSEAVMWKFVLVLLLTAIAILVAQLVVGCAGDPDARRRGEQCRCRSPMPMQG